MMTSNERHNGWRRCTCGFALLAIVSLSSSFHTHGADCDQITLGLAPLIDLGGEQYLGQFVGGLYPGGSNAVPPIHAAVGEDRAAAVQPLNQQGMPSPEGRYVLLSIGMSNAAQEFCSQNGQLPCDPWTLMGQANEHPDVNHEELAIANGAFPGQVASDWTSPDAPVYDIIGDVILAPQGLSEAQVVAVWLKVANDTPSVALPTANADAFALLAHLGDISRALASRYPNLEMVFVSSRTYAGYADIALNPEPYAYESGFAVKWLIEAQLKQMNGGVVDAVAGDLDFTSVAPWLVWGPYPWADGLNPRSDGLIWWCADFEEDGTHPSQAGEEKVASMLLQFMLDSPFVAPWFTSTDGKGRPADLDGDGHVGTIDLLILLGNWGDCASCDNCLGDLDDDCRVRANDLIILLGDWG